MFSILRCLALLHAFGLLVAYPYQPGFAKLKSNVDCLKTPAPLSYHVHVTYMLTNDKQISDVSAFREVALKHFAPLLGENPVCQGTDVEPSGRYGKYYSNGLSTILPLMYLFIF